MLVRGCGPTLGCGAMHLENSGEGVHPQGHAKVCRSLGCGPRARDDGTMGLARDSDLDHTGPPSARSGRLVAPWEYGLDGRGA
eukprot:1771697-Prymnesium_polylepis.1